MLWSFSVLSIFGLAVSSPIDNKLIRADVLNGDLRNSAIEQQLLDLLETLRKDMLTGTDDIPVLDPFEIDHLVVSEKDLPVPGLDLVLTDTRVDKLSTFVVDELNVRMTTLIPLRYRLTLNGYIPVLEVKSDHYELSVPIEDLLVFGKGDVKINIIEPRIKANVIVRPTLGINSLTIRMQECEIKFSLKGFEPQVNGLLGGDEALNNFINTFLRYLVVDLVQLYEDHITETLSAIVLDIANEILEDLNLFDLIG